MSTWRVLRWNFAWWEIALLCPFLLLPACAPVLPSGPDRRPGRGVLPDDAARRPGPAVTVAAAAFDWWGAGLIAGILIAIVVAAAVAGRLAERDE